MYCWCSGAGDSSRADSMPWKRLEHSSDERTERGTAALVARMDHHVVSDNPPARGLLINVKRQARDGLGDNADGLPKWRIAER